jgi:hypothetical protein
LIIATYTESKKPSYMESVESRLEMFKHPQLRCILSLKENSIDMEKVWEEQGILLMNLQRSSVMGEEENRVVGALSINKLVDIALQRKDAKKRLYLIVDECQKFLTPDIKTILDETRKYGLILLAFHQRLSQLDRDTASALETAKMKIIFSTKEKPRPQRHFEFVRRDGHHEETVMHEVRPYPADPVKLAEYIDHLLKDFYPREQVDRILQSNDYEKELAEDDFGH